MHFCGGGLLFDGVAPKFTCSLFMCSVISRPNLLLGRENEHLYG